MMFAIDPDRTDGMDDPLCRAFEPWAQSRLTRRAAPKSSAELHQMRAGGSVDRAVASVIQAAGRIHVLINNAGIPSAGVSEAFTSD